MTDIPEYELHLARVTLLAAAVASVVVELFRSLVVSGETGCHYVHLSDAKKNVNDT